MEWKCFKEEYPRSSCGVLIMIKDYSGEYDVKDHLFYGYVFDSCDYIYIIFDITTQASMAWKVLKDYDVKDIYWWYYSSFSIQYQPERLSEKTSKEEATV